MARGRGKDFRRRRFGASDRRITGENGHVGAEDDTEGTLGNALEPSNSAGQSFFRVLAWAGTGWHDRPVSRSGGRSGPDARAGLA